MHSFIKNISQYFFRKNTNIYLTNTTNINHLYVNRYILFKLFTIINSIKEHFLKEIIND